MPLEKYSDAAIAWARAAEDEIARLRAKIESDRQEWIAHMGALGPMLKEAKADGMLDTLIEANAWPLPKCAITDDDIREATREAIELRPQIEEEAREGRVTIWGVPVTADGVSVRQKRGRR